MTQPVLFQSLRPTDPYGNALWTGPNAQGVIDLDPTLRRTSGRDVLSQSLVRRLTTGRGTVIDSPNDCFDIRSWLSEGMTQTQLQQLGSIIQNEVLRDQRVTSAQVTATVNGNIFTAVLALQSGYGPFSLTLQVSQVTIAVLTSNQ